MVFIIARNSVDDLQPSTDSHALTTISFEGIVFGMRSHKLAVPGDIVIKVSGEKPLAWRTGNLLTN